MKRMLFPLIIILLVFAGCVSNKTFKQHQRKVQELEAIQGHQQGDIDMLAKDIVDARKKLDEIIIRMNAVDEELLALPGMQTQLDDSASEILALQEELVTLQGTLTEQLDILEMDLEDNLDAFTDHLRELKDENKTFATKEELAAVIEESSRISRVLAELTGEVQSLSEDFVKSDSLLSEDAKAEQESKISALAEIRGRIAALESELGAIREGNLQGKADLENLRRRVDAVNTELSTLTSDLQDVILKERGAAQKKREAAMNTQYQAALAQYYKRNHEQSILMFEDFLKTYSNVPLSANAHYWIAENYYAAANFTKALREFQNVVSLFPDHDKAPDAQLKIGMCYYNMNDHNAARQELDLVKTQYPDYAHMDLVNKYLRLSNQ